MVNEIARHTQHYGRNTFVVEIHAIRNARPELLREPPFLDCAEVDITCVLWVIIERTRDVDDNRRASVGKLPLM